MILKNRWIGVEPIAETDVIEKRGIEKLDLIIAGILFVQIGLVQL